MIDIDIPWSLDLLAVTLAVLVLVKALREMVRGILP